MREIPRVLGETRRHFWLAQRMAQAHGLDLAGAAERGDLDQETWAAMVQCCRGCGWTEGCERFLQRAAASGEWPEACRNRIGLATLRAHEEMACEEMAREEMAREEMACEEMEDAQ